MSNNLSAIVFCFSKFCLNKRDLISLWWSCRGTWQTNCGARDGACLTQLGNGFANARLSAWVGRCRNGEKSSGQTWRLIFYFLVHSDAALFYGCHSIDDNSYTAAIERESEANMSTPIKDLYRYKSRSTDGEHEQRLYAGHPTRDCLAYYHDWWDNPCLGRVDSWVAHKTR